MQKKDETATKISPSLYCKAGPRQREKCIPPGWPRECSSASPTRTADGPDLEPIGSAASILPARQAFVAAYAANASRTRPDRGSCSLQHPAAERGDDRAAIATYEAQLPATTHRRQDAWPSRHLALSVPTPHNLFFPLHASPLTTPRSNLQHQLLVHIHGSRQWLGVIPLIHIHGSSIPAGSSRSFTFTGPLQYVTAEWEAAFLRQAREFLFFPLIPREASK